MDESRKILFEAHKKKIEHFISLYENLQMKNREMQDELGRKNSEIEAYRGKLESSNNIIKELEQKIDKLQLAGAFKASAVDVKEAKQNINRLVREIDKCISLLNN